MAKFLKKYQKFIFFSITVKPLNFNEKFFFFNEILN